MQCYLCGGPHQFDTSVPSVKWNLVIRAQGLPEYLCTTCIVRAFVKAGVSFTAQLYGDGFHGDAIEIRVNDAVANDAALIQDQNCYLRSALSRIADIAREEHDRACAAGVDADAK
jgi:hypothetical protein